MNSLARVAMAISAAAIAAAILSCSSYDLSGEPVDAIAVNKVNPAFAADIAPVVQLKCMFCHTDPLIRSKFVPGDVPPGPDALNHLSTQANFDSYVSSGRIKARVIDGSPSPMPPNFATPLTDDEKAAIAAYIKTVSASPAAAGANALKFCASTTSVKKFADVQSITTANCTRCHSTGGLASSIPLTTAAEFKIMRDSAIGDLGNKTMPQDNPAAFANTAGEAALLDWLCGGSDLQ